MMALVREPISEARAFYFATVCSTSCSFSVQMYLLQMTEVGTPDGRGHSKDADPTCMGAEAELKREGRAVDRRSRHVPE